MSTPNTVMLSVDDILRRYGLRDRRAARKLMDEAGAFSVAGKLLIDPADLEAWEAERKAVRRAQTAPAPQAKARPRPAPRKPREPRKEPLAPGWWRRPDEHRS